MAYMNMLVWKKWPKTLKQPTRISRSSIEICLHNFKKIFANGFSVDFGPKLDGAWGRGRAVILCSD